jgi:hypothetical protein
MARTLLVVLTAALLSVIAIDAGQYVHVSEWAGVGTIIYTTLATCWTMATIWTAGPRMAQYLTQIGVKQAEKAPDIMAAAKKEIEARLARRSTEDGTESTP